MRSRRVVEHADEIRAVTAFAVQHGLRVVTTEPERRLVRLSGSAAQFSEAFQVSLGIYDAGQGEFRSYGGPLTVPAGLLPSVESILGLDNRPLVKLRAVRDDSPADSIGHLPTEVAGLYSFPVTVNGAGQCIAIIELGGGYRDSDLTAAFEAMSLPVPEVVPVSVDGGQNSLDGQHDLEVALDLQVAGGAAPGARLAVYFGPDTSAKSFVDGVSQAAHDTANTPSVISLSWGGTEGKWTKPERDSMNSALQDAANLGISVFASSGDDLATNGEPDGRAHVVFPAASPWAIGCGGTIMISFLDKLEPEIVWNYGDRGTGGGISDDAAVPAFQAGIVLPPSVNDGKYRRGVPDVAGSADKHNGYKIVLNGQAENAGGTSAVPPLWAGLTARLNQLRPPAGTLGFFLPRLYQWHVAAPTRDITVGNNSPSGQPKLGYAAGPGWDACTGWGSPDGNRLAMVLARTIKAAGSIAAVDWFDTTLRYRIYCTDQQNQIQEFCFDRVWSVGTTFPAAGPSSRLAALSWQDSDLRVHLRLYYQDTQNNIREHRWDGEWQAGAILPTAAPGSGLAAIGWTDTGGIHIRVYYQDAQNNIREHRWDGEWQAGAILPTAAPGSGLAAIGWTDTGGIHIRIYYQDLHNIVQEQLWDGEWQAGATLLTASPGCKLAAIHWTANDSHHLRVYYNSIGIAARESAYDAGWYNGQFIVPVG